MLNHATQIGSLLLRELLHVEEFLAAFLTANCCSAEHVQPESQRMQRLHHSIVQVPRDSSPFRSRGPGPQPAQNVNIVDRRGHAVGEIPEETQLPFRSAPAASPEQE